MFGVMTLFLLPGSENLLRDLFPDQVVGRPHCRDRLRIAEQPLDTPP
jgi:hypothetical protein